MKRTLSTVFFLLAICPAVAHADAYVIIANPKYTGSTAADDLCNAFLGKVFEVQIADQNGGKFRDEFFLRLTGREPNQVRALWARMIFTGKAHPTLIFASDADVKTFVSRTPNALGYIRPESVDGSVKVIFSLP